MLSNMKSNKKDDVQKKKKKGAHMRGTSAWRLLLLSEGKDGSLEVKGSLFVYVLFITNRSDMRRR